MEQLKPFRLSKRTVLFCFIFVLFQIAFIFILDRCINKTQLYEISSELSSELAPLYEKFQKGDFLYTTYIPILGRPVKVYVVDNPRGAKCGFIPLDKEISQFWIVDSGCYEVCRYNNTHLFVSIDDGFALDLERQEYGPTNEVP